MQCSLMGYRGNTTCHLHLLHIHTCLKARVYMEHKSDLWHIPRYPTRNYYITTMYVVDQI